MENIKERYDLYSDFDVEKHLKTFVDYFEAVIFPDGKVEYAIPSHQEKLIRIGMEKSGKSRQEYLDSVPEEYYANFLSFLLLDTGCVSVWSCGYAAEKMTEKQKEMLRVLIEKGLTKENKF